MGSSGSFTERYHAARVFPRAAQISGMAFLYNDKKSMVILAKEFIEKADAFSLHNSPLQVDTRSIKMRRRPYVEPRQLPQHMVAKNAIMKKYQSESTERSEPSCPPLAYTFFQSFPQVACLVSTRQGGVSKGPFASLNLSLSVGDEQSHVHQNRKRFFSRFPIDISTLIQGQMVHSSHIETITQVPVGEPHRRLSNTDGFITNRAHLGLFITIADCAAVAFFDPQQHVIALIHVGWRGAACGILPKAVDLMKQQFGCNPAHIRVGVSPCIGPCCLELHPNNLSIFPVVLAPFIRQKQDRTISFDLWSALYQQCIDAGLHPTHIEMAEICTACHTQQFYSYRAEQRVTGRFAVLLALNDS